MIVLKIEDYLNVCNTGDVKRVREYFDSLAKSEIESIRDDHNARYDMPFGEVFFAFRFVLNSNKCI